MSQKRNQHKTSHIYVFGIIVSVEYCFYMQMELWYYSALVAMLSLISFNFECVFVHVLVTLQTLDLYLSSGAPFTEKGLTDIIWISN